MVEKFMNNIVPETLRGRIISWEVIQISGQKKLFLSLLWLKQSGLEEKNQTHRSVIKTHNTLTHNQCFHQDVIILTFVSLFEDTAWVHLGCYNEIAQIREFISNKNVFLRVLESEKSKVMVPTDSVR